VQLNAPITSYLGEGIHGFYKDVDETLLKPKLQHDSNGRFQCENRKKNNPFGNWIIYDRIENRKRTLVEWAISIKYKIRNTMFQMKAQRRYAWRSPNDVTNTEIDYILQIGQAMS
jgi:hypothetical protein